MNNPRYGKKIVKLWLSKEEKEAIEFRLNRQINTEQNMTEIGDIILTAKNRGDLE